MKEGSYLTDEAEDALAKLRDATIRVTHDETLVTEEERVHQMYVLLWKRMGNPTAKQVAALAEEIEPIEARVMDRKSRFLEVHALLRDYRQAMVPLERTGAAIELAVIENDEKRDRAQHEEFARWAEAQGIDVPPFSNAHFKLLRALIRARGAFTSFHETVTSFSQFVQQRSLKEYRRRRRWRRLFLWLAGAALLALNIVISTFLCELINVAFKLNGWINFKWQVFAAVVVFCALEFPFFRKWQRKLSMVEGQILREVLGYLGMTERSLVYEEAGTLSQFRDINKRLYRFRTPPGDEGSEEEVA